MSELLSAGVFIEESAATTNIVGPVSTSNMGIATWTTQGPSNVATLVTSFDQYVKTFGSFDRRSYGTYAMAAFFANGGRRAFVVRVTPGDATSAQCRVQGLTTRQLLELGDGVATVYSKTSSTSLIKDNSGASPLVIGGLTVKYRAEGVAVTDETAKKRDGTTGLTTLTAVVKYEGRINPASLPTFDPDLDAVEPGTFTIKWKCSTVTKSIVFTGSDLATPSATKTNGAGSVVTVDLRSGIFSLLIDASEAPVIGDNAVAITVSYMPTSATKTLTNDTTADVHSNMGILGASLNGGGTATSALTNPPGGTQSYVNVANGAYQLVFTAGATNIPHNKARILATYKTYDWTFNPVSAGTWANDLSVRVQGSPNYFDALTQTYSRFTLFVLQTDSAGNTAIKETYEDLVFDDPTSTFYFADIVNEFSSLVRVVEPGGDEAPPQLNGIAERQVLAGGDDSDAGRLISATLTGTVVAKRSLVITYTDSNSVARTIKDDGKGNLTGDIDATYVGATANTINYTTGAVDFKTVVVAGPKGVKADSLVTAVYCTVATETSHTEVFGDATAGYTAGTDGTFDSTNYGRSQFTSPSLAPDYQGLYALDRIDELMQVIIPDFAGDLTVTGDLLDYANSRANQASGGDRFIILAVPKGSSAVEAVDWFRNRLVRFSNYAALYWPWIVVADPLANGRKLTMPPLGHVAGIYARTDVNRNVGKAPGGTIDGALNFLIGLELVPTQGERDYVYPNKINPFISSAQTGTAVWGVRTIAQDSQWKYINARRTFMFCEKSIYNSIFWTVFENNGPALWARVKASLSSFLMASYSQGLFAGTSPDQAFFVVCDETNNTPDTINQGLLQVRVGLSIARPAEFILVNFQQKLIS